MRADERQVTTIEAIGVARPEEVAYDSKSSYCGADAEPTDDEAFASVVPAAAKL